MARKSEEKIKGARNAENQHRSSKEQEKLKMNTKDRNEHSPNTLNASSPP
jgi:hypothetical protein